MSKYSETVGSFIRTGSYPLEANYIFKTLDELKDFYNLPENLPTRYVGMVRMVENQSNLGGGEIDFYVLEYKQPVNLTEHPEYSYNWRHLISSSSLDAIEYRIYLEEEARKDLEKVVATNENNINNLREQISQVDIKTAYNKYDIKKIAGTESDDVGSYLDTLRYKSITELSNALSNFLDTFDNDDETVNTLKELQSFLEGFSDLDKLKDVLDKSLGDIIGTPIPSEDFSSLRKIEDFVRLFQLVVTNALHNLQTELDRTLVGVGLSLDGSYSPDLETHYLKNATSVMNALKTLDAMISRIHYDFQSSDSVKLEAVTDEITDTTTVTAQVRLSDDSDIQLKDSGLYTKLETEYENGILIIKVNGEVRSTHDIGLSALVEDSYYDSTTETIVILFKLHNGEVQRVEIPADKIITEWEVNNLENSAIELTRTRVINGPDTLSADVKISSDPNNILTKINGEMFVSDVDTLTKVSWFKVECVGDVEITTDLLHISHVPTDRPVVIIVPNDCDSIRSILVGGTGYINKVWGIPFNIKDYAEWMNNVTEWHQCIFDFAPGTHLDEHTFDFVNYDRTVLFYDCDFKNVHNFMVIYGSIPPRYTFYLDVSASTNTMWWCMKGNDLTLMAEDTTYFIMSQVNPLVEITHKTPIFWQGYTKPWFGYYDTYFDDETGEDYYTHYAKYALKMEGSSGAFFGPHSQVVGWIDMSKYTGIFVINNITTMVLLDRLGISIDFSANVIDSECWKWISILAKTVKNKTITMSGENYLNLEPETRLRFIDKGWNIAVNWNNRSDGVLWKHWHEMLQLTLFTTADSSLTTYGILRQSIPELNTNLLRASEGMWLTESNDVGDGRSFCLEVQTNNPEEWIEVTEEYKLNFQDALNRKLQEMSNGYL